MNSKKSCGTSSVSVVWKRLFIGLCAVCIIFGGALCIYKFTDIKYWGGGPYYSNNWYEPYVSQARDLSEVTGCEVAMVGDSLTMYGLWDEFFPDLTVVNRGIGSDVTEGVLNRLDTVIEVNPQKVFLMIGTNDVARRIDRDKSVANMAKILETLEYQLPNSKIYVESVLPRTAKYATDIEALNDEYKSLCDKRNNVTFIDMYSLYLREDGKPKTELFANDGYHMSGQGYAVWIEEIKGYVYGTKSMRD